MNPIQQVTIKGENSQRHRDVNNLPGIPEFCPLIKRTEEIKAYILMNLKEKALHVSSKIPKNVVTQAAAFLLLKDSQASFVIGNEPSTQDRVLRWGDAIRKAGKTPISGLITYNARVKDELDPIFAAATIAFGFVNIHPFEDGNGRIHRFECLYEHLFADTGLV